MDKMHHDHIHICEPIDMSQKLFKHALKFSLNRLTTLAVSIGTPTVGTMVAVYAILFSSMGLPLEDIALLVPFDWCL